MKKNPVPKVGLKELNAYANDIALEKILRILVFYRLKAKCEDSDFENFCEQLLRGHFAENYEVYYSKALKIINKEKN